MTQKKIEHMKNITQIGEMIMKKQEREEIQNKKKNLEKNYQMKTYQIIMKFQELKKMQLQNKLRKVLENQQRKPIQTKPKKILNKK